MSRHERTGWRDSALSERHRMYGMNCPALDIDFVMLEFDKEQASAIVEYKNEHAAPQYPSHPSYRALVDLGDKSGLPVFAVRYATDFSWWRVVPLNDEARKYVPEKMEVNEVEWVRILYLTRGRELPENVADAIRKGDYW